MLLEATCWDKDRFRNDYMGEFDVAVEDIFANGKVVQEVSPRYTKESNDVADIVSAAMVHSQRSKQRKKEGG